MSGLDSARSIFASTIPQIAPAARAKIVRENSRKGYQTQPQTLEAAGYTFFFTTLPRTVKPSVVLEFYRGRWQMELADRRLAVTRKEYELFEQHTLVDREQDLGPA